MNNNYYEYFNNNFRGNYISEDEIYPVASQYRQNDMPNNFGEMISMEDYITNMNGNMQNDMKNVNSCGLYKSEEGFVRGNMFPKLYSPYKNYRPNKPKASSEKEDLMLQIDELCFALIDMNLYLDVHPNDECVISLYNKYLKRKKDLTDEYETKYGPITTSGKALDKNPWSWNKDKSAWERGY